MSGPVNGARWLPPVDPSAQALPSGGLPEGPTSHRGQGQKLILLLHVPELEQGEPEVELSSPDPCGAPFHHRTVPRQQQV